MKRTLVLTLAAGLAVAGCHGGKHEDPILQLGAQESLAMGKELMAKEKYKWPANIELEYEVPEGSSVMAEMRKCLEFCKTALA